MEESKIYDLIDLGLLNKWKDEIDKTESNTWFFANAQKAFEELEKELNEQEKKLLKDYSLAFEIKLEHIYYNLKIKILNFGIKIGMELERSFAQFAE